MDPKQSHHQGQAFLRQQLRQRRLDFPPLRAAACAISLSVSSIELNFCPGPGQQLEGYVFSQVS